MTAKFKRLTAIALFSIIASISADAPWEIMTVASKQRAHALIEALPDDATLENHLYAFELRGDIEAGLADAKTGRATDEELRREYGLR